MLNQEDIKQIGAEMEERLAPRISEQVEKRLLPRLDEMEERLAPRISDEVEKRLLPQIASVIADKILPTLEEMQAEINNIKRDMVTKDYLDEKLGDLKGDMILKHRKQEKRADLLHGFLRQKSILKESEAKQLNELRIFPYPPSLSSQN